MKLRYELLIVTVRLCLALLVIVLNVMWFCLLIAAFVAGTYLLT